MPSMGVDASVYAHARGRRARAPRGCLPRNAQLFSSDFFSNARAQRVLSRGPASPSRALGVLSPTRAAATPRHIRVAKVLTVEKTVIRFRPADGSLRKRVRTATTTRCHETTHSARAYMTVESGVVSPDKSENAPANIRTPSLSAAMQAADSMSGRPCSGGQGRRSMQARMPACQESVPARLARWRLLAGPTPAALSSTGQP